jgi:hypothetical protein
MAPYQMFQEPKQERLLKSASNSQWGVVVSESGQKQDNTIHTAIEQLSYAFIPYLDSRLSAVARVEPDARGSENVAIVPTVVTNARLFRLRPTVNDLATIREAAEPADVADEVPWTWCYRAGTSALARYNADLFRDMRKRYEHAFPHLYRVQSDIVLRPMWFAVVSLPGLPLFLDVLPAAFASCRQHGDDPAA